MHAYTAYTQAGSFGWVDAADVASAHIAAYETAEAGGKRLLCASAALTWTDVAATLKDLFPNQPVDCTPPAGGPGLLMGLDTSRLQGFGWVARPVRESFKAQAESLARLGFLELQ